MNEQSPLPFGVAARGELACIARALVLLARRRVRRRSQRVGMCVRFANGASAPIYRETVIAGRTAADPCVLVVAFRLRLVRGRGHALFRGESLLNTSLFAGYPGYVSKLWLAHDEHGVYRGIYEWDGADRAGHYARCLWRVLALVCEPNSIHYHVLPDLARDAWLAEPSRGPSTESDDEAAWWRVVAA